MQINATSCCPCCPSWSYIISGYKFTEDSKKCLNPTFEWNVSITHQNNISSELWFSQTSCLVDFSYSLFLLGNELAWGCWSCCLQYNSMVTVLYIKGAPHLRFGPTAHVFQALDGKWTDGWTDMFYMSVEDHCTAMPLTLSGLHTRCLIRAVLYTTNPRWASIITANIMASSVDPLHGFHCDLQHCWAPSDTHRRTRRCCCI